MVLAGFVNTKLHAVYELIFFVKKMVCSRIFLFWLQQYSFDLELETGKPNGNSQIFRSFDWFNL